MSVVMMIAQSLVLNPDHDTWVWRGRVPLGRVTWAVGGQHGKSLLLDWTYRLTTNTAKWPDFAPVGHVGGRPVVLVTDDETDDALRSRLAAARAALGRVYILRGMKGIPREAATLARIVGELGAGAVFLVDPALWAGARARAFAAALAELAHGQQIAVAVALSGSTLGEQRVVGAAPLGTVLAVASDPGDRERHLLVPVFGSLPYTPALAFRVTTDPAVGAPYLVWEDLP